MQPLKPAEFVAKSKKSFSKTAVLFADDFINTLKQGRDMYVFLACPPNVPEKYQARINAAWRAVFARMLVQHMSKELSYAERHRLAQHIK